MDVVGTMVWLHDTEERAGMERTRPVGLRSFADGIGILGSATCALHCIAAPVFLVAGTARPDSFVSDESFHQMLLWAILRSILAVTRSLLDREAVELAVYA